MNKFIYFLFLGFVGFMRIIPFWLIHVVSNFLWLLMYKIFGYRKKVVMQNLQNSFPEKTPKELKKLASLFYKNLCDITLESLKGFSMSKKQVLKRFRITNPEVVNQYFDQGKDVLFLASHYANWEWGIQAAGMQLKHDVFSIYKPLSNPYIEAFSNKRRSQFAMNMVAMQNTREVFAAESEKPRGFIMAGDQNPSNSKKAIWVDFLNQDTACLHGIESYARRANIPLIYFDVQRLRRGFYTLEVIQLHDSPQDTKHGEVTQIYMKTLENIIRKKPQDWLWSHKRWKNTRTKSNSDNTHK